MPTDMRSSTLIMVAKYSNEGTQSGMIFWWLNKTFHKLGKGHRSFIHRRLEVMGSMIPFLFVFNIVCVTISWSLVVISYHKMGVFILSLSEIACHYSNLNRFHTACTMRYFLGIIIKGKGGISSKITVLHPLVLLFMVNW